MLKARLGKPGFCAKAKRAQVCAIIAVVSLMYLIQQARLYSSRPITDDDNKYFGTHAVSCKPLKIGTFHFRNSEFLLKNPIFVQSAITQWDCIEQCITRNLSHVGFLTASVAPTDGSWQTNCYCGENVKTLDLTNRILASSESENNFLLLVKLFYITSTCKKGRQITDKDLKDNFLGIFYGDIYTNQDYTITLKDYLADVCYTYCERNYFHLAIVSATNICTCHNTRSKLKLLVRLDNADYDVTKKRHLAVWLTWADDSFCSKKQFLPADKESGHDCVGLISFAGSGNTFLRSMLETATGIYTGSVYNDTDVYNKGMLGEMLTGCSRTLCVKDHIYPDKSSTLKNYTKVILLIRNPFDALVAEFNRRTSQSHVGLAQRASYYSREWSKFVVPMTNQWKNSITKVLESNVSKHTVYYQDLIEHPEREIKKILAFIRHPSRDPFWSRDFKLSSDRMFCLATEDFGLFKRQARPKQFRPFTSAVINFVNIAIKKVRKVLAQQLCSSCKMLPPYLVESTDAKAGIYVSRVTKNHGKMIGESIKLKSSDSSILKPYL